MELGRHVNGPDASYPNYQNDALDQSVIQDSFYPTVFRSGWDIQSIPLTNWLNQYMPFDFSPETGGFTPEKNQVYDYYNALNYIKEQTSTYPTMVDMIDAFTTAEAYVPVYTLSWSTPMRIYREILLIFRTVLPL